MEAAERAEQQAAAPADGSRGVEYEYVDDGPSGSSPAERRHAADDAAARRRARPRRAERAHEPDWRADAEAALTTGNS